MPSLAFILIQVNSKLDGCQLGNPSQLSKDKGSKKKKKKKKKKQKLKKKKKKKTIFNGIRIITGSNLVAVHSFC